MWESLYTIGHWTVLIIGFIMTAGTLLSIFRHPHWVIRNWDFPRFQIALIAAACFIIYAIAFFTSHWLDWIFMACMVLTVGWQAYRIFPYTPLASSPVENSEDGNPDSAMRLITSNVQKENRSFDLWMKVITREEPDLILTLETDQAWEKALAPLQDTYPHCIRQVQSNAYGMILFSRFPLENTEIRFIVQEDVPSIHTDIILRSGDRIRFHGIHPRPPEPVRGKDSTARDAELIVVGRELQGGENIPRVIVGDLNDVAWSHTTEIFLKLSGLLDPRLGRGFYNTFPAHISFLRCPLDHVFHSDAFRLVELRTLEYVGSDHLPVLVHLSYEPRARSEQPQPEAEAEDKQFARQRVKREKQEGEMQNSELQSPDNDPEGAQNVMKQGEKKEDD